MNQLPAHLQQYQTRDLGESLSRNLGATAPPYVSIAGSRFTLIDAAGNEVPCAGHDAQIGVYIDACIIDAGDHKSRVFYENDYDPQAPRYAPPECWSDNGVGPSVSCSKPQARTCTPDPQGVTGCRWSVWGSAISNQGNQIPACQEVQKLALIVPQMPQAVFLLRVPPNSHKHLRSYNELAKRNGIRLPDVITRIYFDRTTQGTLLFAAQAYIDAPTAELREAAYIEKKTDALVGRTDIARQPATAQISVQPNTTNPQILGMGNANRPMAVPQVNQWPTQPNPTPTQPNSALAQPFATASTTAQPATFGPTPPGSGSMPAIGAQPVATLTGLPMQPAALQTNGAGPAVGIPAPAAGGQGRRRRRTQAEIQAAQQATQQPQTTAAPLKAPFPVSQAPGSLPGQLDAGFGMSPGVEASSSDEVKKALDDFFGSN